MRELCEKGGMYLRTSDEVGSGSATYQKNQTDQNLTRDYGTYCRPELQHLLSLLRLDRVYHRAEGCSLYSAEDGQEISVLDLLGGYGSTLLGHNREELRDVIRGFLERKGPIHAQASIRSESAKLAVQLNEMISSRFNSKVSYVTTLVNTGTEAIEAAIKHALMEWQDRREKVLLLLERSRDQLIRSQSREVGLIENAINQILNLQPIFVALEGAFHGKTAGSLSLTSNSNYSQMYPTRALNTHFLKKTATHGDIQSLFDRHLISLAG